MPEISTKPYMLRAIYEWCTDSGFTPYLAVKVDAATTVPMEYVKMDNEAIQFKARFGGVSREIYVPVHNVLAIYANENGQGMAFEVTAPAADGHAPGSGALAADTAPAAASPALASVPTGSPETTTAELSPNPDDNNEPPKKGGRPTLTRIK